MKFEQENNKDSFDLMKELEIQTEERNFDVSSEVLEDETQFNAEFDTEKLKEIAEEKISENSDAMYDSSQLAPAIVDGSDALINHLFPIFYEKSAFTEDERKNLKVLSWKIKNSNKQRETTLNDEDLRLSSMFADYEAYCESLPLTATEKKSIINPLAVLLKDVNVQTSPQNALLIAVAMVMLPRLLPIGINKFSNNK